MYSFRVFSLIAAGICYGVRYYEAMEPPRRPGRVSFGVLFNEATRRERDIGFPNPLPPDP